MRGSRAFISQLYKEQYEKLFHAAFYVIGEAELAKDIVQDTFVTAISHLPDLLAHPKPEAWLMLTLRNLVRNEQRRSAHKTIPLQTVFNEPAATLPPPFESLLPPQLTAEERTLLSWRFERKLSYQEMSVLLGMPESSCRSRVSRIVAKCREYLEKLDD